ncbi:metal ABC transporter solute-binding protein, Zn/Mn family [Streptomyces sp. NPDC092296]|uniref:metal ABC transporter solute-binding protein, Zn/Mn family n=1 Tax=Streptomyces sp. NPDC092296 TaxID=3366012 RepID=UPI00382F6AB2
MARNRVPARPLVALSAGLLLLTACGGSTGTTAAGPAASAASARTGGPVVVATTTWEAALAKAAGAEDVKVLVPATVKHAPDYELKPSDLTAVAGADFVLYASFEPFAGRVKEAAGSKAEPVEVNLDERRAATAAEVTKLGKVFGTEQAAARWNSAFTAQYDTLAQQVKAAWGTGQAPVVVAQTFTTWAAELAGLQPAGTYGPDAVTPAQLAELSAKKPQFVLENEAMSTGTVLPGSGAEQLDIVNYPGQDLDLLAVYRNAADQLVRAFSGS